VRKDGPDVNGEERGIIAPYGICTLWMPDEAKTNWLGIEMVKISTKIKEAIGAIDNLSKFKKFSKLKASYIEYDKFAGSNLRQGYFCYSCIYWVNTLGGQCMLVKK